MSVTAVVPCKGRLTDLRQSVPFLLDQADVAGYRVLVVDYGCPDKTFAWCGDLAVPHLDCVEILDRVEPFSLSRARNCGNRVAESRLLVAMDADCLPRGRRTVHRMVAPVLAGAISSHVTLIRNDGSTFPAHSLMAYRRDAWLEVGGYDEEMAGWGFEDSDFYLRVRALGLCRELQASSADLDRLEHNDDARIQHYAEKALIDNWLRNREHARTRSALNPRGFAGFRYRCFRGDTRTIVEGEFAPQCVCAQ